MDKYMFWSSVAFFLCCMCGAFLSFIRGEVAEEINHFLAMATIPLTANLIICVLIWAYRGLF